ncbi:phage integrase Arm DNA-binding domain-containing protein [Vibrio harveyi]|uniref:phage integrase Arm DNA-binding domain-containing protein n=1 Tax=Vibrio harveyi TaxID=669 RepID=UPI003CFB63BD
MARPRTDSKIDIPNLYRKFDKRTEKYYYQYKNPVTGKFTSLGSDHEHACKSAREANLIIEQRGLRQIMAEQAKQNAKLEQEQGILVDEFCEKMLKRYEQYECEKLSPKTISEKIRHLELFRSRFGTKRIKTITAKDVFCVIDEYLSVGKNAAAKQIRSFWSVLFKEAQYMGEVDYGFNPVLATRPIEYTVKRARIDDEQFAAFYEQCLNGKPLYFKHAVKLAVTTGLRRTDITNLKFSDVKNGYLHVSLGKSGGKTKLAFPLSLVHPVIGQSLGDIIAECRGKVVSQYMVHAMTNMGRSHRGAKIDASRLSDGFRLMWSRAGLEDNAETRPTFHELRSFSIRTYGANAKYLQKLLGHKREDQTEVYLDDRNGEKTHYLELPETA